MDTVKASAWAKSWQPQGGHAQELLLEEFRQNEGGMDDDGDDDDKDKVAAAAAGPGAPRGGLDKVRCLDGLRGIACLLVFNYHFIWPWTPMTMLGYGAMPPYTAEPYGGLASLPIICLLHRGRPMVSIFFAISGYVLCRHVLRAIRERRLDAAYQGLGSSAFRRAFRLFVPPTISMFLVAVLAQMGAFKSEDAIHKGPDSVYINGTVLSSRWNATCPNGTFGATGAADVAQYMGLRKPWRLEDMAFDGTDQLCLHATSELLSPITLYAFAHEYEAETSKRAKALNETAGSPSSKTDASRGGGEPPNYNWVRFGGTWEEHPFIHDSISYAARNFTRAYAEWANPFSFGMYYPRYDPHTFTIPVEFRGSIVIYMFLLGTAALRPRWRLRLAGGLSAYSLFIGRWDVAVFLGGMMCSEIDISRPSDAGGQGGLPLGGAGGTRGGAWHRDTAMRSLGTFVALWFLSYPDVGAEYTPGFGYLSLWVPRYYSHEGWRFYQAMGALILLPCVLRSAWLRGVLEGPVPQYLGKISFSFYLVHGPVLHSLGFWIMPRLFEHLGTHAGFATGWAVLMGVSLCLAHWWYRRIDVWSITIGRRVERLLVDQ